MSRSPSGLIIATATVLSLAACTAGPMAPPQGVAVAPPPPGLTANPDQAFLDRAATGTRGQVMLGRLAQQRALAPGLRAFGAHIAAEHGRLHARLLAVTQRQGLIANISTPNAAALTALAGPDFDRQFIADQVTDEAQALGLFESEAQTGRNPALRAFARAALPELRRDLARAQSLAARVGS